MQSLVCAYIITGLVLLIVSRNVFAILQPLLLAWYFVAVETLR